MNAVKVLDSINPLSTTKKFSLCLKRFLLHSTIIITLLCTENFIYKFAHYRFYILFTKA